MPSPEDVGRSFIDAFNRRDADGIVALCHPEIDFSPTGIATGGRRRAYRGHDGMRELIRVGVIPA